MVKNYLALKISLFILVIVFSLISIRNKVAQAQLGVIATISLSEPRGLGVNPFTNLVYVSNPRNDTVTVINGATDTILTVINVRTFDAPFSPAGIAVNSKTNRIYVANSGVGGVTVIDGSTNIPLLLVGTGRGSFRVAVNKTNDRVYVTNPADNTVSVIDGATNSVIDTISGINGPYGIGVNELTNHIYVSSHRDGTVSVIDGITGAVVGRISLVSVQPENALLSGVAVNKVTNRIYVTGQLPLGAGLTPAMFVIDGNTNSLLTTIQRVGGLNQEPGVNPLLNRVFIPGCNGLCIIDGKNNAVTGGVSGVGVNPFEPKVNVLTGRIYVAASGSGTGIGTVTVVQDLLPNTPVGKNVVVGPINGVTVTYSEVTQTGHTTVDINSSGPTPPSGFKLGVPSTYYNIFSTAEFIPPVEVCVGYNEFQFANESKLKLFHLENGQWTGITTSLNTQNNVVCGQVSSFSEFALFEEVSIESITRDIKFFGLEDKLGNVLLAQLDRAELVLEEGNKKAAKGTLTAFIKLVEAQRGKKITIKQADALINDAQFLLNTLDSNFLDTILKFLLFGWLDKLSALILSVGKI